MASTQQQREQLLLELQQEHEDVQLWQERQEHLIEQQWLEQQVQDHQEELQQQWEELQQQQQEQQWEELQQQEDEDQQQGAMLPRSTSATLGSLEANVLSTVLSNSNLDTRTKNAKRCKAKRMMNMAKKQAKQADKDEALYSLLMQIMPEHKTKYGDVDTYAWSDKLGALPGDSASRFAQPVCLKRWFKAKATSKQQDDRENIEPSDA